MISLDVIKEEMGRVRRACSEIEQRARVVTELYEELADAAYRLPGNPDGIEKPIQSGDFRVTDPTGTAALLGQLKRMRYQLRQATKGLRRVSPILEEVEATLLQAFKETDPDSDFKEKLRRLRELELAAEG